jgi:cell shape-determining protein MreD
MVVHSTRIFGVLVDSISAVVLGEEFFHFPVVLLGADREFEIFASNGVPILFHNQLHTMCNNIGGRGDNVLCKPS